MNEDRSAEFLRRWQALATNLGLSEASSQPIGDDLLARYSTEDRHYHNTDHILAMLDGFEALKAEFDDPLSAELAIFFHDAVHDPSRTDNEAASAALLHEKLAGLVDKTVLESAQFTIEATQKHILTPQVDTNLVLDLDMAILAQPWPVYERYAQAVMREYVPVYGETAYRQGRAKFLNSTIEQGTIFLTDAFKPFNQSAIRNMQSEAEILVSGSYSPTDKMRRSQ